MFVQSSHFYVHTHARTHTHTHKQVRMYVCMYVCSENHSGPLKCGYSSFRTLFKRFHYKLTSEIRTASLQGITECVFLKRSHWAVHYSNYCYITSGAVHLIGICLVPEDTMYIPPSSSLLIPKSDILMASSSPTRQFRAARSRWIQCWDSRYAIPWGNVDIVLWL